MNGSPRRALLFAALAYAVVSVVLFGESFSSDRIFFPIHTLRLEPWIEDLDPELSSTLAENEFTLPSDKLVSFRADDQIGIDALRGGRLPLWNPTTAGGVPHLAQALYGVFYPLNLLFIWFEPEQIYGLLAAIHHFLAALFTFLFLRRIGAQNGGAFLGGLAFGFSTYLLLRAHYYQYVECYAWLPLGLYLVERWRDARSPLIPLCLLSLVTGTVLLSGWPQTAAYTIFAWALLAIWRGAQEDLQGSPLNALKGVLSLFLLCIVSPVVALASERGRALKVALAILLLVVAAIALSGSEYRLWWLSFGPYAILLAMFLSMRGKTAFLKNLLCFSGAIGLGVAIAAIQYLPAVEWMPFANRQGLGAPELLVMMGLKPLYLLDAVWPGLFGNPDFSHLESMFHLTRLLALNPAEVNQANHFGNLFENGVYFGLLPLALIPVGLAWKSMRRGFLFCVLVLYGAFALGMSFVVYPLYFAGFFVGTDPRRALGVVVFAACALAGLGAGALLKGHRRTLGKTLAALCALFALGSLWVGQFASESVIHQVLVDHATELAVALDQNPDVPTDALDAATSLVQDVTTRSGIFGLLSAAALFLLASGLRAAVTLAIAGAVVAIDLVLAGSVYTETIPAEGFFRSHPLITHLQETVGRSGRLARMTEEKTISLKQISLPPNLAGSFGLLDAWCYTVSPPKRWMRLAREIAPDDSSFDLAGSVYITPLFRSEHLDSRVLDLMAVRAVVGLGERPEALPDDFEVTGEFGASYVLQNRGALPRVFTVSEAIDVNSLSEDEAVSLLMGDDFDPGRTVLLEGAGDLSRNASSIPARTAQLIVDAPEELTVGLSSKGGGGYLVVLDSYAPGWKASVDGAETPVLIANHAFRAVPFGDDSKQIRMVYQPWSTAWGKRITLLAIALALLGLCLGIVRERRAPIS